MNEMIPEPEAYFSRLTPRRSALLQNLETEAEAETIPIVGPVVGELLYLLTRLGRAQHVLELGTATGYSAIFMAQACQATGGQLFTLENDPDLVGRAAQNLKTAGLESYAHVVQADALAWLAQTATTFDLIFMDIEKEDYVRALPHCFRVLKPHGLLIADNVGFKDAETFNRTIFDDPAWRPVSLHALLPGHSPRYDGLCLAVKTA